MPFADPRSTPPDRIESLLDEVVQLPDAAQPDALAALCAAHPGLAAGLRDRYAVFRRLA